MLFRSGNEVVKDMKDPNKELLQKLPNENCEVFVESFFNQTNIFTDSISNSELFRKLVLKYRSAINESGVEKAIDLALLAT